MIKTDSEKLQTKIDKILTLPFFPPNVTSGKFYKTTHDDNDGVPESNYVGVYVDDQGDVYLSQCDRPWLRYRTYGGGGQFPLIRNALLLLADAIRQEGQI